MKALQEIVQITEQSIAELLRSRYGETEGAPSGERRRHPRWPFPAPVELWVPLADGEEDLVLGRTLNLSLRGVGVLVDVPLEPGQEVSLAIHEPEATLYGRAVVRHCTEVECGNLMGLEFIFKAIVDGENEGP